ncbi:hypothetical protein V1509DRAFT_615454 [Lipomyces kononenkoae]
MKYNAVIFGRSSRLHRQGSQLLPKSPSILFQLPSLAHSRRGNIVHCDRKHIETITNASTIRPQLRNFSSVVSLFGDQKTKANDHRTACLETDNTSRNKKRQSETAPEHTLLDDVTDAGREVTAIAKDVNRKDVNRRKPSNRLNLRPTTTTGDDGTEQDKVPDQEQDCTHGIADQSKTIEDSLKSRRKSRYDDEDFQLDRSILLTRPEKWFSTPRSQTKPSNFPDLSTFSRRMQNNPYVAILASKSRLCGNWRVKLPTNLLQELSMFKLVKDKSSALSAASDAMVSDRKGAVIDYVYLPLDPESKKHVVGGSTYHILKREHVRQASWKHLKYVRSVAGVPSEKSGWAPDMDSLIERRLRRRLEISARNLRLSGVSGFYVDEKRANEEGIVIAELSWSSLAHANGNLKDSDFYYNERHKVPVIRYFANQLCGFETSTIVREYLTDLARKTAGTGNFMSWPTSIFVTENANTRSFLMHLWRLRVYIGDRVG